MTMRSVRRFLEPDGTKPFFTSTFKHILRYTRAYLIKMTKIAVMQEENNRSYKYARRRKSIISKRQGGSEDNPRPYDESILSVSCMAGMISNQGLVGVSQKESDLSLRVLASAEF